MKYHVLVMMLRARRIGRLMNPQSPTPDVPAPEGRRPTGPDSRRLPGGGGFSIGSDSSIDDDLDGPELVGWGAGLVELAAPEKICSTARWGSEEVSRDGRVGTYLHVPSVLAQDTFVPLPRCGGIARCHCAELLQRLLLGHRERHGGGVMVRMLGLEAGS